MPCDATGPVLAFASPMNTPRSFLLGNHHVMPYNRQPCCRGVPENYFEPTACCFFCGLIAGDFRGRAAGEGVPL